MQAPIETFDVYEYVYKPFWQSTSFKVTAGIFLFIFLTLFSYLIYRYIQHRRGIRRRLDPWEWAFEEIDRLNPAAARGKDDFKRIYFDLTRVLKLYVGMRYGWQVADKTDQELVLFLQEEGWDSQLTESLTTLLESAVKVRFANEAGLKAQIDHDIEIMRAIIHRTIPIQSEQ